MLTRRPEKELKSECILVSAMVHISQETFVHQQAWESGAKWENNKLSVFACVITVYIYRCKAVMLIILHCMK